MENTSNISIEHPGTFIAEELEARGWSQADLAYILGMSAQQLNPIIAGKNNITPDLAALLGDAFDVSADFFANLQKMYDLQRAKRPSPDVKTRASWLSTFPVREMIKRGWIEETDSNLLELQMKRFFGKSSIDDIPFVGEGKIIAHAAKKTCYDNTTAVQYAWLHRVKKIAENIECPVYSKEILLANLAKIRSHMLDLDDLIHIPSILRASGVRFVLVEALSGSKIDGVCLWLNDQPVIGMTTRLDRLDNFCFVLRHEIEHVLNGHGKEMTFSPIDELTGNENIEISAEEKIANDASSEFLIPRKFLDSFIARKSPFISEKDMLSFAIRMEINPAIVVGQIQYRTQKYTWLKKYQKSFREYILEWPFKDGWSYQFPTGL